MKSLISILLCVFCFSHLLAQTDVDVYMDVIHESIEELKGETYKASASFKISDVWNKLPKEQKIKIENKIVEELLKIAKNLDSPNKFLACNLITKISSNSGKYVVKLLEIYDNSSLSKDPDYIIIMEGKNDVRWCVDYYLSDSTHFCSTYVYLHKGPITEYVERRSRIVWNIGKSGDKRYIPFLAKELSSNSPIKSNDAMYALMYMAKRLNEKEIRDGFVPIDYDVCQNLSLIKDLVDEGVYKIIYERVKKVIK